MKTKSMVSEKYVKPGNKVLALFSKLTGFGIVGLTSHESVKNDETTVDTKGNLPAGNKKSRVVKICQDQERCQQHFNCQPGKYEHSQTSIDLWFYLSPQS